MPETDIFKPIDRIKHAEHWNNERTKLGAEINRVGVDIAGLQAVQHKRLMTEFAHHTADILAMVADMLSPQRIEDIRELVLES